MQRSSETIRHACRRARQGAGRADQPGKIPGGYHPSGGPAGGANARSAMPRCRAGWISSAKPWASMRSRPFSPPPSIGQRHDQAHHPSGACLGRMDCLGLAGLPPQRDGDAAPDGRGADLCAALCAVHPGRIAGEDDLDAPDLNAPTSTAAQGNEPTPTENERSNGGQTKSSPQLIASDRYSDRETRAVPPTSPALLDPTPPARSATSLRPNSRALARPRKLQTWAHRVLRRKEYVSRGRRQRNRGCLSSKDLRSLSEPGADPLNAARSALDKSESTESLPRSIDKSELSHPEPRRLRDREHVRFVTKQPCLICGRTPSYLAPSSLCPTTRTGPQGQR